jgi:hypothetical protein
MDQLQSASFLRREAYIRYAGILLTLSPIGNFLWSSALSGIYHWWHPHVLLMIMKSVSGVLWFLWVSAFIAGLQMLKGKRSSWTFTLCIIGMNVVFGIITFKRDIQMGWFQPALSLLINIGLFGLIYTQEFHQRLERNLMAARAKLNRPFSIKIQGNFLVNFGAMGNWARIVEVSQSTIRLRSVSGEAPHQIEFRTIELALAKGLVIQARFSARVGSDFIFRITNLTPITHPILHRWAIGASKRAPTSTQKAA